MDTSYNIPINVVANVVKIPCLLMTNGLPGDVAIPSGHHATIYVHEYNLTINTIQKCIYDVIVFRFVASELFSI